jgi:hypothetical protein
MYMFHKLLRRSGVDRVAGTERSASTSAYVSSGGHIREKWQHGE